MDRIKIWPNGIVFEFGMLHGWHMFSFVNLRRIINYSIEKSENGGYPLLSWPVWRHMAVNKLKVPEGLAWSYFEVFDAIQESTPNERIAKATKRSELSLQEYQSQRYVSTLKFVLFLFTQTISSNRLRNSSFSERFPDQKQPGSARAKNEKHMEMMTDNLEKMIDLASRLDKKDVDLEAIRALSSMLHCELEGNPVSFDGLIMKLAGETSYTQITRSCERKKLEGFIRQYLVTNPLSASERGKKMISWYDRKPGRALSNHEVAPLNQREISISRISSHSLCVKKDYLTDATIRISKCSDVRFYFCGSIKNVLVDSCHSCTFLFSAVSSIAKINDSHNCTVIVGARLVHLSNTVDCKLFTATPMRPILTGPNKNLEIGPFNTNYNNIEADITRAGLSIQPNRWNDPLIVESNENTSWKFYPTEDFFFHAIPYDVSDGIDLIKKADFHFPLPTEYLEAVHQKQSIMRNWRRNMRADDQFGPLMKQWVKVEFNKWMEENKYSKEISEVQQV